MKNKLINSNWIIVISSLVLILLMHPFLKYPFDMYHHLLWINDYYNNDILPKSSRYIWHYFWSKVFFILNLDNTKLFERAYIIHYAQTIISYISVYYFSFTLIKYILPKTNKLNYHSIAALSTLIWFTIYATASVGYHLVWIQWYSINYQISLPITLLATAFLFNFLFNKSNKKYFYLLLSIISLSIVLLIHSAEFVYFLMYLLLLSIIYFDKIFNFLIKNKLITFLIFVSITMLLSYINKIISLISYKTPKLILYITNFDFIGLYNYILKEGDLIINLFNRASASINELIIISTYTLIPILIISLYLKRVGHLINIRLVIFLILSSLFIYIPIYQFTAGIASTLTYKLLVNRFYYSSTIFMAIPIFSYLILLVLKKEKYLILQTILTGTILLVTFIYSRYAIGTTQSYYKNIQSIKNAWNERKVGFNLSKEQINKIGQELNRYKKKYGDNIIIFAREDIAFILKYVYRENVYLPIKWRGKKLEKDFYIKAYNTQYSKNKKILFNIPKEFPSYEPYR